MCIRDRGTTRVGKTRLAELLIAQDIRRGEVVIVFDPKGDVDLLRRVFAEVGLVLRRLGCVPRRPGFDSHRNQQPGGCGGQPMAG